MFIVMIVTGRPIRLSVFFLPISMIHLAFFSLGVGLFISAMAVYYPDVKEMYLIVLTAWMYLSPIIYPEEILPPLAQEWLPRLNPIYPLIKIFRLPLYDGRLPTFAELWPATIGALIAFVIGWFFFTKRADEFAYRV
jgi:ABC-type polysaccharide/polyol phosphate export permease